jgi:hypothetical protein
MMPSLTSKHSPRGRRGSLRGSLDDAPRQPGVYLAREGIDGPIVYVGMAGKRAGGGRPQGIRGRLRVYASGKALTSGLGEAVADRAFADANWLRERVAEVERGEPMRAIAWGQAVFGRADLHVRWTVTADRTSAIQLERKVGSRLAAAGLWNRQQFESEPPP